MKIHFENRIYQNEWWFSLGISIFRHRHFEKYHFHIIFDILFWYIEVVIGEN